MGWRGALVCRAGSPAAMGVAFIDQETIKGLSDRPQGESGRRHSGKRRLTAPGEPRFPSGRSAEISPPGVLAPRDSRQPAGAPDPALTWPDRMKHKQPAALPGLLAGVPRVLPGHREAGRPPQGRVCKTFEGRLRPS